MLIIVACTPFILKKNQRQLLLQISILYVQIMSCKFQPTVYKHLCSTIFSIPIYLFYTLHTSKINLHAWGNGGERILRCSGNNNLKEISINQ